MQTLGRSLNKILKPMALKNGFTDARIFSQWASIVGPRVAQSIRPQKLNVGVLTVCAAQSGAALEAQHQAGSLIERINRHFGYKAVKSIRVVQVGPWLQPLQAKPTLEPDRGAKVRANARVQEVQDQDIKKALARLGAFVEMQYSRPHNGQ